MADAYHQMTGDLALSPTGDLLMASGPLATQQRVLRRLLTNPYAYIWHVAYGAGLARYIGQVAPALRIAAVITRQMKLERGVAADPPPTVAISADQNGYVTATIKYGDQSGQLNTLTVPIGG